MNVALMGNDGSERKIRLNYDKTSLSIQICCNISFWVKLVITLLYWSIAVFVFLFVTQLTGLVLTALPRDYWYIMWFCLLYSSELEDCPYTFTYDSSSPFMNYRSFTHCTVSYNFFFASEFWTRWFLCKKMGLKFRIAWAKRNGKWLFGVIELTI